jgi:serine/threonine-protein kinase
MADDPRLQQLLDQLLTGHATPEEVCAPCPELLPVVRNRWRRMRRLRADLDALFPPPDVPSTKQDALVPPPEPTARPPGGTALPGIPGYEVEGVLGRGGMGIVFRARHLRLNRLVALKMSLACAYCEPRELERLQREAEAVASLQHENIVRVYDVGDHEGRPFFTMEYVEGGSLADKLTGAPQPVQQAAALVATLGEAVRVAHQGGVVHRDLKPGNVLLTADGTPKISDFGIARRLQGGAPLTQSGVPVGTPSYMAPEQARGRTLAIGPAVDVYALGAILYELLTGRPPFQGETAAATIHQVVTQEPVPPSRLNDKVTRDLETICLKCLHKEPGRRYASAAALADDLRRFGEGRPIQARPVGWAERSWRWCRRNPTAAALVATALVLVGLSSGGGAWFVGQKHDRQGRAREAVEKALGQFPGLREQGRWPEAQAVLTQAKSRLDDADSDDLRRRLTQAGEDLELAATLERIRLTPAIDGSHFDYPGMAEAYRQAFANAGLDVWGDEETVAVQIRDSELRPQLVMALDHWAYVADELKDQHAMTRLLDLAQRADPDPVWGNRFRDPKLWGNQEALRQLALEAQERLDKDAPANRPPTPLVTLLAKKLGQKDNQAEPLLRAAQGRHPEDFWLNYALGQALRESKPAEAVGFYRAALATRPTVAGVHYEVSVALWRQGQVDEASRASRMAIELDPKWAPGHHQLGVCCWQDGGKLDEAIAEFRRAIELDPKYTPAHYMLGSCWQDRGQLDEAIAEFRRAIELDPKYAPAHDLLGRCWQDRGQLDEAIAEYRRAIQLDPKWAPAHYQLGTCWVARGRLDEAVAEFRRASEGDPGACLPHLGLVDALVGSGRVQEACTAVRRGLDLVPAKEPRRPALQEKLKLCERMLALDARLPGLLEGKEQPAAAELLKLADLCRDCGRPHAAVDLYARAFAAQPELAETDRYNAACAAARAGVGDAADGARLGGPERAGLRRQALHWLRADLTLRTNLSKGGKSVAAVLTFWQKDTDLAGVRDPAELAKLPDAERDQWQRLWAEVAALLAADPLEQGRGHAARQDWAQAADRYARALKGGQTNDGHTLFEYAALLLLAGDRSGYVKACADMIEKCDKKEGPRAYHVARACTLAPDSVADAELPGRLAAKELQDNAGQFWSLTEQGALAYRAGRYQEAVPLFERSLKADPKSGRAVLNWLWLALTNHRLDKAEEARRWLSKAQAWLDQYRDGLPAGAEPEVGLGLHNWLEAHVLRREAEAVLAPR